MSRTIAQLKAAEPPHALQLLKQDKPAPGPGRVLVRITVRPVNPTDLISIRTGRLLDGNKQQHPVIGSEGFGIVQEIGEGVTRFRPGQRVIPLVFIDYYRTGQGSWQDYIVLSEEHIVAVPDSISDEAAAQFVINPWTVYGLLDDLSVPKGEYILQTAAGSVVGRQLIQLAKAWGIKTINVVRRDKWKEELKDLGADEVINSETEDIVERVKEITGGKRAYAAVDAVGGSLTKIVAASVRDGGSVFVYGKFSGWDVTISFRDLTRGVQLSAWMLINYIAREGMHAHVSQEVFKLLEEDKFIIPPVGKQFPLEEFLAAIEESEKESRGGKVFLIS